jgi:hypothetical protein
MSNITIVANSILEIIENECKKRCGALATIATLRRV